MAHPEGHKIGLERADIAGGGRIDQNPVVHDPEQRVLGTELRSAAPGFTVGLVEREQVVTDLCRGGALRGDAAGRAATERRGRSGGEARDQQQDHGPVTDPGHEKAWLTPRGCPVGDKVVEPGSP